MTDVFISYSREDAPRIERLAEALEADGFSVWWDRNLAAGTRFSKETEERLNEAKIVLVAWSRASRESMWVADEASVGRDRGTLVPIAIDAVEPPIGFRQIQTTPFAEWSGSRGDPVYARLVNTLRTRLGAPAPAAPQGPTSGRPIIAILPFSTLSTDQEIAFLAEGLTEDATVALAKNRHLLVSRVSREVHKAQSADSRVIARSLGARYAVEGSVRKMGARARIGAQLVEAESGTRLWARNFDADYAALADSPDDIVEKIAGNIFSQLISAEAERARRLPPERLGPWEYCHRAAATIARGGGTNDQLREAMTELAAALRMAPDYPLAHAILSWAYNAALTNGIYEDAERAPFIDGAKRHLKMARALADDDQLCLSYIGAAENYAGMQERSIETLENIIARNPASPLAWFLICQPYAYVGRFEEARAAIDRAAELAPEAGYAQLHDWYRGLVEMLAGDYEKAAKLVAARALNTPGYGYAHVVLAICAAMNGDETAARRHIARAKEHNPQMRPDKVAPILQAQSDKEKGKREYALVERLWGA